MMNADFAEQIKRRYGTSFVITIDNYSKIVGDARVEIIDGDVVEKMAASFEHSGIKDNVYDVLRPFVKMHGLGTVRSDGLTFILETDENGRVLRSRLPDVSFIRLARLQDVNRQRAFVGAPDLAVEVVSPTERQRITQRKVADYLEHDSEVWVIYPLDREIHVYRDDVRPRIYGEDDTLETPLFPGLQIAVAPLFEDDFA